MIRHLPPPSTKVNLALERPNDDLRDSLPTVRNFRCPNNSHLLATLHFSLPPPPHTSHQATRRRDDDRTPQLLRVTARNSIPSPSQKHSAPSAGKDIEDDQAQLSCRSFSCLHTLLPPSSLLLLLPSPPSQTQCCSSLYPTTYECSTTGSTDHSTRHDLLS